MRLLSALLIGLVFGIGIATSGMINPAKVLNFFDIAGTWDPSLAFVMGGAVLVTLVAFRFVLRRAVPLYGERFHLPTLTQLDRKLLGGAALFGIGWGLAGYCPGPALATILSGNAETWLFVPAMLVGGALQRWQNRRSEG